MDQQLLEILVCPSTGLSLSMADREDLAAVNAAIKAGTVCHGDGSAVTRPVQALLITRDHSTAYRVEDGIPMLLPELGMPMPATT